MSGKLDGTTVEQVSDILQYRTQQLRNVSRPFGSPSDTSRKKVESGTVVLRDKVTLRCQGQLGKAVLAVSKEFDIDEVEALILVRSFFYNEGLPSGKDEKDTIDPEEVVEAITPFYYSERLHALRALIPLFRAQSGGSDIIGDVASEIIQEILPDGKKFAEDIIAEYVRKTKAQIPENFSSDVKKAALWAKQNAKEQLILLEVLFWTMWDYNSCDGRLVVKIYETAYNTNLGSSQANSTLLLDEEASQLQQDMAALWILITLEVLELERVADPHDMKIVADPADAGIYWSSPESLQKIHQIVTSHADSQFACTYAAWAFFLSRFVTVCTSLKELPASYRPFYELVVPPIDRSYSKTKEPAHVLMASAAMQPEAGLLPLLLTLLTNSPLFVTSLAWKTGSTITDPNAIAYRSVLKGLP